MANYTSCTGSSYHDPSLKVLYGIAEDVGHYVPWERSSLRGENRMWRDKIDRFKNCLRYMLQRPALHLDDNRSMCYRTWDGWTCWKDTPPGQTAYASCPRFVAGFSALRKAEKVCTLNGTWFRHPVSGNVWSNYTACVDEGDLQFRNFVNLLYVIGYTLSSAALLFSLFIFCYFRSLRCRRITVHKNLFLSFIINNLCWIVWYNHVISNPDVIERNPIWCRALHVVTQYFLLCNYLWMFCEGFYLHTLLVVAFIAEEKILTSLLLIGWGFPILPTVAYAVVRGLDTEASDMCWVEHDVWYTYILSVTVGLSIMFSFAFLVNIVRVLVTKLRVLNSPDNQRSRKAVRATIILLPLLGLHYVLTPFRPQCGGGILLVYEVISAIFTSLQGLCVAILFCFIHDEVVAALRQTYSKRLRFRTTYRTFYADTSVTVSSSTTTEDQVAHKVSRVLG
ncbi:calcitonin gene-related peptide type 1 receptor-like [Amblyomma americanum]